MTPNTANMYSFLTVHENLRFIRRLCGGSKGQVQLLSEILQLPNGRRLIYDLQTSEEVRVALAAVLMTSPNLLLIITPTKEQDRSMKERIWNLLRTVSREEKVAILLCTDDPEEAAQADDVSILANGCLVARDSPNRLLKEFQCETLEGVCKTLSKHRDGLEAVGVITKTSALDPGTKTGPRYDAPSAGKHTVASKKIPPCSIGKTLQLGVLSVSWYRIYMLFLNDLITFKRLNFRFLLCLWIMHLSVLGIAVDFNRLGLYNSFRPELPVALVKSNSTSPLVDPFLASLEKGDLPFVSSPNDTSLQRSYSDLDEALASLERGETCAVMKVGRNFSSVPHYQFVLRSRADGSKAPNESVLEIDVVAKSQEIRFILQRAIVLAAQKLPLRIEEATNGSSAEMESRFNEPVFGSRLISHIEFLAPSFLIYTTLGAVVWMAQMQALSAIVDVMIFRFEIVGVKSLEIAISAFFHLFCIQFVQICLMLFYMCLWNWYDLLPLKGSLFLASFLFLMQGLLGIVVGLTISSLGLLLSKILYVTLWPLTIGPITFVIWAAFGPRVRFAGIIRCLDFYVLPTTSTEALRNILYRGWGLEEDDVLGAFAGLATRIVLFYLLALFLLKLQRFRW